MKILYLLILSHLLADFVFQGKGLVQKKNESLPAIAIHAFVFFASAIILLGLFQFLSGLLLVLVFSLGLVHFFTDILKVYLEKTYPAKRFEWLFLDQFVHIGLIFIACSYFKGDLFKFSAFKYFSDKFILILIGYFLMWGATYFIKRLLEKIPLIKEDKTEFNVGQIIGALERALIFTLVMVNQYAVIGFVLAAKSIARFEDLKNRQFAEYYLIGTLSSSFIAISTGIIIKHLISI